MWSTDRLPPDGGGVAGLSGWHHERCEVGASEFDWYEQATSTSVGTHWENYQQVRDLSRDRMLWWLRIWVWLFCALLGTLICLLTWLNALATAASLQHFALWYIGKESQMMLYDLYFWLTIEYALDTTSWQGMEEGSVCVQIGSVSLPDEWNPHYQIF